MRVIAGELGGRTLKAPGGHRTRPTSDRVREALFMTLEPLTGLRVVDLYAGSGALGIEALSRGAEHVDFVESDRYARRVLSENLIALALGPRSRVWSLTLPRGLVRLAAILRRADVVLLDPPYGGEAAISTLAWLGARDRVQHGARVVLEHHVRDEIAPQFGSLAQSRERRYGETVVRTFRVDDQARPVRANQEPQ